MNPSMPFFPGSPTATAVYMAVAAPRGFACLDAIDGSICPDHSPSSVLGLGIRSGKAFHSSNRSRLSIPLPLEERAETRHHRTDRGPEMKAKAQARHRFLASGQVLLLCLPAAVSCASRVAGCLTCLGPTSPRHWRWAPISLLLSWEIHAQHQQDAWSLFSQG